MSRIKSSTILGSEFLFKTEATKLKTGEKTVTESNQTYVASQVGQVPNVTRNPKGPDGFRKPSNYWFKDVVYFPGMQSKEKEGFLLPAEVLHTEQQTTNAGVHTIRNVSGYAVVKAGPRNVASSDIWALQQEARMKIRNSILDEKLDVAMVLAEIGKTANTAANLLLRVGRSMDAIRRRKPETFRYLMHGQMGVDKRRPTQAFLKEASGTFLEWKYGIMPSVYDLEGATLALDSIADGSLFDRPPLLVARASVKRSDKVDCLFEHQLLKGTQLVQIPAETAISCRADFTVDGEALRGLSEFGIGLTSIPTIAYDLTPFSFVANMVVPMAELIKAWGALASVNIRGYTETTYTKYMLPPHRYTADYNSFRGITIKTEAKTVTKFTRSGSTAIPMPLPYIRNPVKIGNIQTVLALFTQMRDKPKRQPKIYSFDHKDL